MREHFAVLSENCTRRARTHTMVTRSARIPCLFFFESHRMCFSARRAFNPSFRLVFILQQLVHESRVFYDTFNNSESYSLVVYPNWFSSSGSASISSLLRLTLPALARSIWINLKGLNGILHDFFRKRGKSNHLHARGRIHFTFFVQKFVVTFVVRALRFWIPHKLPNTKVCYIRMQNVHYWPVSGGIGVWPALEVPLVTLPSLTLRPSSELVSGVGD